MKLTAAYTQSQSVTLKNESAFEELYTRLSGWTAQAVREVTAGDQSGFEALIEKCVSLLGFMDRCIDVSGNYEVASRILSLHRFAINALVRAKAERDASALSGLPEVFVSLAEIFVAVRSTQEENYKPGGDQG